jgi:phage shock protein A
MTNYDNDLIQLQQKVALKKQLEAKLNDLREQRKVFDKQVIELRVAHRSEQEDVEKLEGKSLANYFYQVVGKLDDKLTEERRQATAARVKLDAAERELAAVDCEIQEIQSQLSELYGCENASIFRFRLSVYARTFYTNT